MHQSLQEGVGHFRAPLLDAGANNPSMTFFSLTQTLRHTPIGTRSGLKPDDAVGLPSSHHAWDQCRRTARHAGWLYPSRELLELLPEQQRFTMCGWIYPMKYPLAEEALRGAGG
jgi:hypothetical protein